MILFLLPSIAHLADFRDIAQPGFFRGFPGTITRPGIARPTLRQLLGAVASSAGVERVFSSFGLVHSKIRNRLGVTKAGKLVFIYKVVNSRQ